MYLVRHIAQLQQDATEGELRISSDLSKAQLILALAKTRPFVDYTNAG